MLRQPRVTFERIAAFPRPAPALALLFVVPFAVFAALYATEVGRLALLDQWERTAIAFGGTVDDARYAELQRLTEHGVAYAAGTSAVRGPGVALFVAALLYGWFTAMRSGTASYSQVLGVTAHAGLILVVRDVVSAPLFYARESVAGVTSLVQFAGGFDEGSPIARFLALIDLFVVWWLVALAIGVSVLYRQSLRRVLMLLAGAYTAGALVLAGAMALADP